MYVDIDWLEMVRKRLRLINATALDDIKWLDCGVPVSYTEEVIEEFKRHGSHNSELHEQFEYKKGEQ